MCLRGSTHDSKVPGPTTRSRGPAVSGLGAVNMLHLKVLCAQNDGCFDENKCQLLTARGFFFDALASNNIKNLHTRGF